VYFLDEDGHPQEVLQYDHLQAALDQGASLGGFAAQQWLPCAVEVCDDVEVLVPSSFPKDDESDESTIPQFEGVKRPTMPGLAIIAVSWLVFLIVGPVVVQLLAPAGTSAGAKAVWRVLIGLCVLVVHPPMIWSATRGRAEGPRRGQRIAAFISAGFMIPGLMLLTLD
jgi:hypothetical protein